MVLVSRRLLTRAALIQWCYDSIVNDRLHNALGVILAAALLLQSLACRGGLVCVGEDHLALAGASSHACCAHENHGDAPSLALSATHDQCGCVDIGVSDDPMQPKRICAAIGFDVPACCVKQILSQSQHDTAPTVKLHRSDQRCLRGVVLLI